jgi:hypothetical protein
MHNRMVENSVKKQALAKLLELRNEFKAASDRSKMQKRVVENLERIEVSWANECAKVAVANRHTTRLSRKGERA